MADEAPAAAEGPQEADTPEIAFDDAAHTLVVDLRALCAIPFDAESSAIESLCAFQFEKGKVMHGPQPGTYAFAGELHTLKTFMRVHFRDATKRKPELVVSFADYGMASTTASGIYVCSLQLPLMKRKNVYENTIRYTKSADIAGFSTINEGITPWSIHLKPALQKLSGVHCAYKLFTSADVTEFIHRPLADRVKELHISAKESLNTFLDGLRRQDKNLAEKQGAHFDAQLQNTVDFLLALPASSYDKPSAQRLVQVNQEGGAEGDAAWLTPSKTSSVMAAAVQAEGLARTAKCKRAAPAATVPPEKQSSLAEAPPKGGGK